MTAAVRIRVAESAAAVIALTMFLPWSSEAGESLTGFQAGEGQLILLASVIIIVLCRMGSRLSWMVAGFAVAAIGRAVMSPDVGVSVGIGPRLGLVAALTALVVLVWNMFAEVRASAPGD